MLQFSDCNVDLPALPSYIRCHLSADCLQVQCCLEVARLRRTFALQLSVDTCLSEVHFGIDNFKNDVSMIKFDFGKSKKRSHLQ